MEQQFGRIPEAVTEKGDTTKWNPLVYLKRLKGIVSHQAEMNMNSQKTWNDFLAKRRSELTADDLKNRHFRFNVEFPDQVPKLDHVEGLDDLKALATKFCSLNRHLIRSAATKLIASLFYLRVNKIFTKEERAKFQVQGLFMTLPRKLAIADEKRNYSLSPKARICCTRQTPSETYLWQIFCIVGTTILYESGPTR